LHDLIVRPSPPLTNVGDLTSRSVVDTETHGWEATCVGQGLLLGERVLRDASLVFNGPIDVVISVDPGTSDSYPSSTFRFFVYREEDRWTSDDLENSAFGEAVMVLRRPRA
jgi:hypothetical protein